MAQVPSNRHSKKHHKQHEKKEPAEIKERKNKDLLAYAVIVILAGIPFLAGKYFELNFPDPFDSGGYVYSAKHILNGARIGIEENPSARVGTLLVNILGVWLLGFNETGPKLIQAVLQIIALLLMFIAMRRLFGKLAASIAVIIASIYLSAPLIAKYGNVKEQHMIAFMVMGISCFVLRQLNGRWFWAVLAGAFASLGPLFKETGLSALAAIGLFVLVQPIFRHRTLKQTGSDILLLFAGALFAILPVCFWLAAVKAPIGYFPYATFLTPIVSIVNSPDTNQAQKPLKIEKVMPAEQEPQKLSLLMKILPGYVRNSWLALDSEGKRQVVLRVLRYYKLLILPISLALGAIIARFIRMVMSVTGKLQPGSKKNYDRFVLLFAVWWLFDMGLLWVSPRSYEQYYLPLNASAAMLAGYIIALYIDKFYASVFKGKWIAIGAAGAVCVIIMSWHIFFGIEISPHSGTSYGKKTRGYVQKWQEISDRINNNLRGQWELIGQYINEHSDANDTMYIWGWYPGMYVAAQRFSCVPSAFESETHTRTPEQLSQLVTSILDAFKANPPKFLVDTYKQDFPWDRPSLELWPINQIKILRQAGIKFNDINEADEAYKQLLSKKINADEARRFEVMKPLREYVMQNYEIVQRQFGPHVLFEIKK